MDNTRCTNAVLNSFHVFPEINVLYGAGVIEHLSNAGYIIEELNLQEITNKKIITLRCFVQQFTTGNYYLYTKGHALALHDGILTDTTYQGANKRHVIGAFKIQMRL